MSDRLLSNYTNDRLIREASQLATLIKGCLVRTTFRADFVIGKDHHGDECTADFKIARNRHFIDHKFIPLARDVLHEADKRGMTTVMTQMFTPQGILAIELGTTALDFQELTEQIYPQPQARSASPDEQQNGSSAGAIILSFPTQRHG